MAGLYLGSTQVTLPGGSSAASPLIEIQNTAMITVTPSATVNVKGGWTEIIASTLEASDQVILLADVNLTANNTATLLDIGVGAIGSEVIVVPDIAISGWIVSSGAFGYSAIRLPLKVPAGSRVVARAQSALASNPTLVGLSLWKGGSLSSATTLETLGISTATSRGTYAGGSTAWIQVVASTSKAYKHLILVPSLAASNASTIAPTLTMGVGASGSEVDLGGKIYCGTSNTEDIRSVYPKPAWPEACVMGGAPSGSRISVKSSITSIHDVCIIGVP